VEAYIGGTVQAGIKAARGDLEGRCVPRDGREAVQQAMYYRQLRGRVSRWLGLKLSDSVIDPRHTAMVLESKTAHQDGALGHG